ncbi:MAG: NERD domain-containing protein [Ilumatobacter sp.]|nr:NERD domain-containing protein [Ilumatobacter sp.]
MGKKLINLRQHDTCAACYGGVARATRAWWDTSRGHVVCTRCRPLDFQPVDAAPIDAAVEVPADHDAVSASVAASIARHPASHAAARAAGDHADDDAVGAEPTPLHIAAWDQRATDERNLARYLDEITAGRAVVLHDRMVPAVRATIDHVVVAPSGIWVIDTNRFGGRIGYRSSDLVHPSAADLQVGPRREAKLVKAMADLCDAIRMTVEPAGDVAASSIRPAVCFSHGSWPGPAHIETIHDVVIAPPAALGAAILQDGWLGPDAINTIATLLTADLPPVARR